MKKIAIIIPTKNRLESFISFAESWKATTEGESDVIVGIDIGDSTYDSILSKYPFTFEYVTPKPFLHILNELALKYSNTYEYIGFMEDDCAFVSPQWESTFISKLDSLGNNGIVWGNDLINRDYIVGLPFLNSSIVKRLGFMAPPCIECLWADHFWKAIVDKFNSGHYFNDIVIEHKHYSTGKTLKDNVSNEIERIGHNDALRYSSYRVNGLNKDLEKLV